ncbi:F-box protein At-B [Euphorbia lathyris]|uniref:F-box protein At-B n=1 Tax=Euphorbia lathyris TaxID=212925 RepID=UPI0033140BE9
MENLPSILITQEILTKLDLEALCTVACVTKTLHSSAYRYVLPFFTSLDLSSSFIPDANSLHYIRNRCNNIKTISLNCQRLSNSFFTPFLAPHIQQLNLYCCSLLTSQIFVSIAENCRFIRVLMVEFAEQDSPHLLEPDLIYMLRRCNLLECLSITIRGTKFYVNFFHSVGCFLPKTLNTLMLKPVLEENAFGVVNNLEGGSYSAYEELSIPVSPSPSVSGLQRLSLVLDVISDRLLITISCILPLLLELDLKDMPNKEPVPNRDLTDNGLQSLCSCRHLTGLTLIRGRHNFQGSFKRVTDMGMFLLSEGCKGLQSVRLGGFSKVSAAGFASLLQSCQKIKNLEIRNAPLLSDLAFYNLIEAPSTLVEVRLLSCNLITSETVKKLSSSKSLEVIDLRGCKSIADSCLYSVSLLQKLTSLNLSGADITDGGLSVLGRGSSPISHLSLRGCKRITDKGISHLLSGGGAIVKTLESLDLAHMPGISDNAILTIVASGKEITELCLRSCFYVTDSSLRALANKRRYEDDSKQLKQLDIYNCTGLSAKALELLRKPLFRGLHWIGIGQIYLGRKRNRVMAEIQNERPWLTMCLDGCEMGCHDGWEYHCRPQDY